MKLLRVKSECPVSPYAPSWDAPIGFSEWDQKEKLDNIRNFLLSKESEILKLPFQGSAGTGLDDKSVTTRYGQYHLFDYATECPELQDLLQWIREQWISYITKDHTQVYTLAFTCWYNIIRNGEEIKTHRHSTQSVAYLSGNMHLDNYDDSYTRYNHMGMDLDVPNVKGGLSLFPSYLQHSVPTYNGSNPRVSLAFDLTIYDPPVYSLQDFLEYRKFIDIEMYQEIKNKLTNV